MKNILLFGAGKSATSLIRYLVRQTDARDWRLVVAENDLALARSKIGMASHATAVRLDVSRETEREALVAGADIVISLLPPTLHYHVALSCLKQGKHLLTASYLDPAIRALESDVREKGLLFLCEMGLDPGIDHMSAVRLIREIRTTGGRIDTFHSHTGGLVAPESDDNPWHYKISWNPRNVVLAGSAGARYLEGGEVKTLAYEELFERPGRLSLPDIGDLAWYPNRDSLSYIPLYGLEEATTFIRTTLRYPQYCRAWKSIVRAGLTDDRLPLDHRSHDIAARNHDRQPLDDHGLSIASWAAALRPFVDETNRAPFEFLGLFDDSPVPPEARTSADVLQHLLETRLAMRPGDRDMIVMVHEIGFERGGRRYVAQSALVAKGEDNLDTAMARTVGLPLGIAAILLLEGRIRLTGLHIPILPEIYDPVLDQLEQEGIRFEDHVAPVP
jgi:saccharopine dehydrogenase-like NADP-dependent oxidoreductase